MNDESQFHGYNMSSILKFSEIADSEFYDMAKNLTTYAFAPAQEKNTEMLTRVVDLYAAFTKFNSEKFGKIENEVNEKVTIEDAPEAAYEAAIEVALTDFFKCLDIELNKNDVRNSQIICATKLSVDHTSAKAEFENQRASMALKILEDQYITPALKELKYLETLRENALVNLQMCKYFEDKVNYNVFATRQLVKDVVNF